MSQADNCARNFPAHPAKQRSWSCQRPESDQLLQFGGMRRVLLGGFPGDRALVHIIGQAAIQRLHAQGPPDWMTELS